MQSLTLTLNIAIYVKQKGKKEGKKEERKERGKERKKNVYLLSLLFFVTSACLTARFLIEITEYLAFSRHCVNSHHTNCSLSQRQPVNNLSTLFALSQMGQGISLQHVFSHVIKCPLHGQTNTAIPIYYLCKKLKTIPLRKMTAVFPLLNCFFGKNTLDLTPISTGLVILSAFPDVPGEWGDVMTGHICPNAARSTSESAKGIWGDPGGRP